MNDLKQYLKIKIIDKRVYISMINIRKLKRICALTGIHLYHENTQIPKGYYISSTQLNQFLSVMNDAGIDVKVIGKE